jgi:hypothetical protein
MPIYALNLFHLAHDDLHPLRERGSQTYLWRTHERLEDLLLKGESSGTDPDHSRRDTGDRLRARIMGISPLRPSNGGARRKP